MTPKPLLNLGTVFSEVSGLATASNKWRIS
jgi:hypothetical protein